MNDSDARSFLARTSCSSRTVYVVLDVIGHSVVDDMCQVINVKTTCCHVCRHEELRHVVSEFLHREVALLLRQVAMQRFGVVSVLYQFVGNILCLYLCTTENYRKDAGVEVNDALQGKIFVLCAHHIVDMVYVLCALIAASDYYFFRFAQVCTRYFINLLAHRCREKQSVTLFRHAGKYGVQVFRKSHVEHLIGLVKHYIAHCSEFCHTSFHKVDESSRSGNDDMHTFLQCANLCFDVCTAIHRYDMHVGDIL